MRSSAIEIFAKLTELIQLQNSKINDVTMRDNFMTSKLLDNITALESLGNIC